MSDEDNNVGSLTAAKRQFLVSLCLFSALLVALALILTNSEETEQESTELEKSAPEPLSRIEQAYLDGQMHGLREHPDTMPAYESEWVMRISEQAIKRDTTFKDANENETMLLVEQFFKGYTERFNEYYDGRAAREFGYQNGLKFDPAIHGLFPTATIGVLHSHRARLEEKFYIADEATWRLFCEAFDAGFVQGYPKVVEGVTVQSRFESVSLFTSEQ